MIFEKLKNMKLDIIEGLYFEISDYFLSIDNISDLDITKDKIHSLTINETGNKYVIKVNAKGLSEEDIKIVFLNFVHFIEYSYLTIYSKKELGDEIVYELISCLPSNDGFYCEVHFKL
ncbi:hypothetical protein WKS79_002034 [Providencia stuartii]